MDEDRGQRWAQDAEIARILFRGPTWEHMVKTGRTKDDGWMDKVELCDRLGTYQVVFALAVLGLILTNFLFIGPWTGPLMLAIIAGGFFGATMIDGYQKELMEELSGVEVVR